MIPQMTRVLTKSMSTVSLTTYTKLIPLSSHHLPSLNMTGKVHEAKGAPSNHCLRKLITRRQGLGFGRDFHNNDDAEVLRPCQFTKTHYIHVVELVELWIADGL